MANVEMKRWGRDHWSTFAYIVSPPLGGKIERTRMRCDPRRHPLLAHAGSVVALSPTRLIGRIDLPNHDDWDCLEDIEAAGLVTNTGTAANPLIKITDKGMYYALRIWRAEQAGGNWSKVNEGCDGFEFIGTSSLG